MLRDIVRGDRDSETSFPSTLPDPRWLSCRHGGFWRRGAEERTARRPLAESECLRARRAPWRNSGRRRRQFLSELGLGGAGMAQEGRRKALGERLQGGGGGRRCVCRD